MDFDSFLTSQRWEILQIVAENPSSPIEIAEKLSTTVSYVSQQLKLLDAARLIKKQKTGSVLKGKPRTVFSISNELVYITLLTRKNSEKKIIYLTPHHKRILSIWMLDDISLHDLFVKLLFKLEEDLDEFDGAFIDQSGKVPKLVLVSDSKVLKSKIGAFIKNFQQKIDFDFISKTQLNKFTRENLVVLYDSLDLLDSQHMLKGGDEKDE